MRGPRNAAVVILFAMFVAVNAGNALHKGGDFDVFLEGGRRWIAAADLYAGSSPGNGVIAPPFHGLFFAPFAALADISLTASRLAWYALNVAALIGGIRWWSAALLARGRGPVPWGHPAVAWGLAAVVLPAQTNFEHQNMNPVLLAATGAAAISIARNRSALAGALLGTAMALKAFPALLVVYLAARRRWVASAVAALVGAALTIAAAARYGVEATGPVILRWIDINQHGGWPTRGQNQSLFASIARWTPDRAEPIAAIVSIGLLLFLVMTAHRAVRHHLETGDPRALQAELAMTLTAAVVLSPIAWDHYYVLVLPALITLSACSRSAARPVVLLSIILLSGLSPVLLGRGLFDAVRHWSPSTVAGLAILMAGLYGVWGEPPNSRRSRARPLAV